MRAKLRPGRARRVLLMAGLLVVALLPAGTRAQTPPPATLSQDPPAAAAPPATPSAPGPAVAARPTLIPESGDPTNADEVVLPEKPVLVLSGSSRWDGGLKALREAFGRIEAELRRAGIAPAGRPLALFVETGDDEFKFDAMVPVAAAPPAAVPAGPQAALPTGMRWGTTPAGKAWRFVHKGPYDDVDSTYGTITVYLDSKNVLAKDAFIEEYVNDIADPADPNLEVNIFVQPR